MSNIVRHFSASEVLAEVRLDFSDYKIDETGLKNKLMSDLKAFRDLVCIPSWKIIHINSGAGELPHDFQSIINGLIVFPDTCYSPDLPLERIVTSSVFTEVEEFIFTNDGCLTSNINRCQDQCVTGEGNRFVETRIIEERPVWFSYKNPTPIQIVQHQRGRELVSQYIEGRINSENQISVYDDQIHCNFEKGIILLEYNAFPLDDEGVPLIPDTGDDSMRDYLDASLRVYLLKSPKMNAQEGFSQYASNFIQLSMSELVFKRHDAKISLTKLQKSQILEHKALMQGRVNNYFSPYRKM